MCALVPVFSTSFSYKGSMDDVPLTPLDEAMDPDLMFGSVAASDWYEGDEDLERYGLYEEGHGYQVSERP